MAICIFSLECPEPEDICSNLEWFAQSEPMAVKDECNNPYFARRCAKTCAEYCQAPCEAFAAVKGKNKSCLLG